jgi:phosphatidylserine/phosphatidylglycerophosphate/cardiolipin synthase-like enzyme
MTTSTNSHPDVWSSHRRAIATLCRICVVMLAVICITGCNLSLAQTSPETRCPPTDVPVHVIDGIYVLPEDGRDPVIEEIDAARCSVDVSIYMITDDEVIDALARAQARGVTVRMLLEATPFGAFGGQVDTLDEISALGISVKYGPDEFRFSHAKYIVVDGAVGIITNQNLTFSSFESNREVGVITTDAEVVRSLSDIFVADWSGEPLYDIADRLVVSPENSRASLVDLLASAEGSIRLYVEVIRDDEIVSGLNDAESRGVEVRLIVNAPDDDLDFEVLGALAQGGVEVRVADHIYVHAKALLIDNDIALIGSHNPTSTSIDNNREVSLEVTDPVAIERVRAIFDYDWLLSAPWYPEARRVDTLAQNPMNIPLALDMPMMYGYCVRTVPMGLAQASR